MYHHQHFDSISSTQEYLKENLDRFHREIGHNSQVLITTSEQLGGVGRTNARWCHIANGLAFSFTVTPNEKTSLTPIEMGVLVKNFIAEKFNVDIKLKWPNDLLNEDGAKCGGIICNYINPDVVIVGLGINLGKISLSELEDIKLASKKKGNAFEHDAGCINETIRVEKQQAPHICKEIYEYIQSHRIKSVVDLISMFNRSCYHLDRDVFIFDNGIDYIGNFIGIGEEGEAIVEINDESKKFLTSSLTILN